VANHARTVELERFQVQCALVAKRSVKAAAAQAQRLNQVFNRRRRVALAPEKLQSLDERFPREAAAMLKEVLAAAVEQVLATSSVRIPLGNGSQYYAASNGSGRRMV